MKPNLYYYFSRENLCNLVVIKVSQLHPKQPLKVPLYFLFRFCELNLPLP